MRPRTLHYSAEFDMFGSTLLRIKKNELELGINETHLKLGESLFDGWLVMPINIIKVLSLGDLYSKPL